MQSKQVADATTVTLSGNGRLAPAGVTESKDRPRRLVLDFPNVGSKAPTQTAIDSPLVSRVRVAVNSRQPLVTRVVMEIAERRRPIASSAAATRAAISTSCSSRRARRNAGRARAGGAVGAPVQPEPPITLQQAMANAAAITPEAAGQPVDPMPALRTGAAVDRARTSAPRR